MLPAFMRKQRWTPLLLVVLPASRQFVDESSHDKYSRAESASWFTKRWQKDSDSSHFEKYLSKQLEHSKDGSLMLWPSLEAGLKKRQLDEMLIQSHISKLQQGSIIDEKDKVALSNTLAEALYGKGITVHDRQLYLKKHGCVKATVEALDIIHKTTVNSAREDCLPADSQKPGCKKRGIVEIGIGFGQWARLLVDKYNIDIVAFDNMISLPLNPRVHTCKTDGYAQYFYQGKVRCGDATIFGKNQINRRYQLDGRILMIIFPDPGPMAIECLQAYIKSNECNDMFIYVGEGRGGANGNSAFFDELESVDDKGAPKWHLQETCKLNPFGEKGFERLFVFKKNIATASQ